MQYRMQPLDVATVPITWDDPAQQTQTSAGAASITFGAPTGGSGGFVYSGATLNKPVGSSATLSGSGLGAYTFTTDVEGPYSVELLVTDSMGATSRATAVLCLDLADPPLTWAQPTDQTQTSAGAASVTFASPSGGTGGYSYSAVLVKPVGSSASLSGSGLGAYTFTTDLAGVYKVVNTVTDSRGITQQSVGVIALSLVTDWKTVYTYDLTDCENIDVSSTGTVNVKKADGVTALITVTKGHTTGTAAVFNGDFVTGSGLVWDQHSTTGAAQNAYLSFNLQEASLDFDNNAYYVEFLVASAVLEGATSSTLHFGVADATGITADPMFGHGFNRPSATTWEDLSRKYGSSATQTAGQAGSGSAIPTTYNVGVLVFGGQMAYIYRGTSATYQGPRVPTAYQGTLGANNNPVSDTHAGIWAGAFAFFISTTNTLAGATSGVLKGIRIYSLQPEA